MRPVFVMVLSALFALAIANNATQWSSVVRDICASNDINWAQRFALNTTRFVTCYKDQVFNVLDCPAGFIFDEDLQGCEPYAEVNISSHWFAHYLYQVGRRLLDPEPQRSSFSTQRHPLHFPVCVGRIRQPWTRLP